MFFQPACFGHGLTLGAVAVTARVIRGVFKAADITLFHVATQGGGATFLDGLHDPAVRKGHRVVVAIMLAVLTEDVGQFALGSCRRLISDGQH